MPTSSTTTLELYQHHVIPSYGRFPLTLARGQGTRVWDENGQAYLDFTAGIAVCSLGHAPAVLQKALAAQAGTLIHTSNLYYTRPQAELAALLNQCVGIPGKIFFANSGAEANEGLYKLARKHGSPQGRYEIITLESSFHGRTLAGIAATGQKKVKVGFEPPVSGFVHAKPTLEAVQSALNERTAAILVEPIQGEGGVRPLEASFLHGLRSLCDTHGLLLLYDEIQCGLGRTGHWCGWHATGAMEAIPDGISWAKGLGGGVPIGAFWARAPYADLLTPGTHATTFGGSPLICAAALAVLNTIAQEDLLTNACERGAQIVAAVKDLPLVREVRGAGLLIGIEIADFVPTEGESGSPALRLTRRLMNAGLLVAPAGEQTIRFLPPLNVTAAECEEAVEILRGVLALAEPVV